MIKKTEQNRLNSYRSPSQGYFGDATDDRQGCQKIECEVDQQCAQNQRCDNYMCKSEF